jgi:hypothetical protein
MQLLAIIVTITVFAVLLVLSAVACNHDRNEPADIHRPDEIENQTHGKDQRRWFWL